MVRLSLFLVQIGLGLLMVPDGPQPTTEQVEETMEKYCEQGDKKIEEINKRLRTGQRKPISTSENIEKGEHWDHDTSCSDDEDVGDTESYHVPSAMRDFLDIDSEAFLSNSGRDMKNILNKVKESEKKVQVTYLCSGLFDEISSESFLFEKRFI
ncbi:F14D16.23 [Arabidopsis thaliana]|uniref:F14D16.23 n=3 Tax=Arabidopsis TaxID=3701 RepID=Q9LMC0_ARATH|nr:uncharacterized protein AT1G19086 [Arabidopsis thaliana]AAF79291.1 F14D16.23 [Arabidopsis thaliana]AEE29800.1 hypothetical protein AT1G19086 [Arabidopsis thaliana]KAG7654813.1 hypothetical protein ISN44_As01g019470 [Arabidopsis suecica]|eukprot:NP_001117310.1 hypothetical protein AT1G19086 [Arabidopsis thaliana]